jgi:hypothetical protein
MAVPGWTPCDIFSVISSPLLLFLQWSERGAWLPYRNLSLSSPFPPLYLSVPKELRFFLLRACSVLHALLQPSLSLYISLLLWEKERERLREVCELNVLWAATARELVYNFSSAIKCFLFCMIGRGVDNISVAPHGNWKTGKRWLKKGSMKALATPASCSCYQYQGWSYG